MKSIFTACLLVLMAVVPVHAQSVEELNQQLEAQKQITELLKQRIRSLEKQLAEKQNDPASVALSTPTTQTEPQPDQAAGDPEENRALERALVRRGITLLPTGSWELTPGFAWAHTGSNAIRDRSDNYIANLEARVGLPWGTMIGVSVPYFIKADREALGDTAGFGNLNLRGWKRFLGQGAGTPSLTGSLSYNAPTGETGGLFPLGSEFHRLSANLNTSKSIDPVVLYGNISYGHTFSEGINGIKVQPGDIIGVSGGASLAITPDISGNLGLSFSFVDEFELEGTQRPGSERTLGFATLGTGFLIGKRHFLSMSANIGITDDAPDITLGFSLPYRF
jgi:hypothetical protein